MKTNFKFLSITSLILIGSQAQAYAPIIRDYISTRAVGMGGVRYTTGLWEDNFFANPARSAYNGEWRLQLPKITAEVGSTTVSNLSTFFKSDGDGLSKFSSAVGEPMSAKFQLFFPGVYIDQFITDKWSFGVGLFVSAQTALALSQSGQIDPTTMMAAGPVFNLSRRLLDEDRLTVGVNARTEIRANSSSGFSVQQFLSGSDLSNAVKGGSGMGFDFDLGSTFRPHWNFFDIDYQIGFAINNILNGEYKNIGKPIKDWPSGPFQSKRSYNLGVSATKKDVPFFREVTLAIETQDNGNNTDGSFYRTLHIGMEALWGVMAGRAGINQGYYTAGLGLDLKYFQLNVATYAEELGLNPGVLEDRRYSLDLGFQI